MQPQIVSYVAKISPCGGIGDRHSGSFTESLKEALPQRSLSFYCEVFTALMLPLCKALMRASIAKHSISSPAPHQGVRH